MPMKMNIIQPRTCCLLSLVLCAWLLTGCGNKPMKQNPVNNYVAEYEAARQQVAAIAPEDAAAIAQNFVDVFNSALETGFRERVSAMYADEVYFNDTITTIREKGVLVDYFEESFGPVETYQVEALDHISRGEDIFVIWKMEMDFRPGRKLRKSLSIGISQLRVNDQSEIIFHQDFWDSTEGLYRHIPVLGSALLRIRNRLQP